MLSLFSFWLGKFLSSGDLDNNNNNNNNNNNCNNDDDDDDDLGQLCIPYLNAYWKCNPSLCGKCFHGHSRTIEAFFTNAKDMLRTCMRRSPQIHYDMQATAILKSTPNGGVGVSRKYFDHDNFLIDSEISMKQKALI